MSDTNSSGTHEVAGTTELENALITVERKAATVHELRVVNADGA